MRIYLGLFCLLLLMADATFASSLSCQESMKKFIFQAKEIEKIEKVENFQTAKINITKYGLEDIPTNRKKFEKLYAQCMSPDKNQFKDLAYKRISQKIVAMNYMTTVIGYTQSNWEKDKNAEWFSRLGYSLVFSVAANALYDKLIKQTGSRFSFILKDYAFGRGAIAGWIGGSLVLFSASNNKKDQAKLEELKNSPTFDQDIQALEQYVNDDRLMNRMTREISQYLSHEKEINVGLGVHDGVDFNHLTPRDLEDPDIQKVVVAAILAQEYESHQAPLRFSGSERVDFYTMDSLYSLLKIPKDILLYQVINKAMCLNSYNVTRGVTQAVGIYTLNQILFADFYGITYKLLRDELLIGQ